MGTTAYGNSTRAKISAPTIGWIFIFSNSSGVSFPGFEMMCSGIASLPMSCSIEAARSACKPASSSPTASPSSTAYTCTRCRCSCRVVLRLDRERQRLDGSEVKRSHLLGVRLFRFEPAKIEPVRAEDRIYDRQREKDSLPAQPPVTDADD